MSNICLPPKVVDGFKQALVSGKINPEKLASMTSEERHKLFSDVVGDGQAKFVNAEFESKLLLKNQQAGFLTWAKNVAGLKPEARRDLISRIERLDKVLNPADEKLFLKDLASTKLGIDVTAAEAKQITTMSQKLQEVAAKQRPDGTFPSESDRMAFGYAKVDFGNHLAQMKLAAEKKSIGEQLKSHPYDTTGRIAGTAKALKASLDNSAIFRQGWKTLSTNPIIWQRNARKSFVDIAKVLGGHNVTREVMADIVSRPNYKHYEKMKLALGNIEEEFPTSLPAKVPGFGRAYKASEQAYEAFLYRTRADVADKYLQVAEAGGTDITNKKQLESIGKLINSLTGRGDLGRLEGTAASTFNNIFFSPRFLKSNIDTLTAHQLQKGVTPFVRKQAAINLAKIVAGTSLVLTVANALHPGSVETDPRSSNFGRIKVGHTTFDVTGGMGSIVTLASRLGPLLILKPAYSKSATTGLLTKLNDGPFSQSGMDVFNDFMDGKFSPIASVFRDLMEGQDFNGNKPTPMNELKNLFVPLPISNAFQSSDPYAANRLVQVIADGLGIATNTNTPQRNQNGSLSNAQQGFKDKIGADAFKQANDEYNKQYNVWYESHKDAIRSMPPDEQSSLITAAKTKIQKSIYAQHDYKAPKANKSDTTKRKSLLDTIK